ncbi:Pectate lyase/Amb allergen [Pseudarthrobacter chlorophenolicus A6]|uniref:Pectate lyase/Amb allergen n=1 Tax=Pseudarthrobacter chlorophenolicus (strain ATCC 700700 / DSM 12829 / CIP 107037 / JCM 12360 / KCTC 9906 / NCIMB 13794 / A6) TaxID=452863 RepID=B8HAN3_PSECP|nr:polysaccharide lyase family 1 protein [Pseudarthrobacter chlorophenolicus]ACL38494.1 Pectate lyase/Amb allergen [Pseudarthrobacter chlorophenolicus A6]SDQ47611.1 pectate lyase [Pseudarthrobacter chlorophenolicus]
MSLPLSIMVAAVVALAGPLPAAPLDGAQLSPASPDLGRQVLAAGDGWASADGGTTGGSGAAPGNVHEVSTRDELAAAVAGNEPKIVYVKQGFNANTAPDGSAITCEDYATGGYSLEAYLAAFDPAQWTGPAAGPLEDARKASSAKQRERVRVNVGSNTTIVGVGDVQLTGFTLNIDNVDNVIVRNLHISDAYDCFPGWNGDTWKTEWDNVVVSGSTHVWLDHLTLDDGETADAAQPRYFGELFLRHDGLLDVVRQADLVTISWSRLVGHDKSLLWGNGDGATADRGKLRVTLHHNELVDLEQRAPRVRFGQAHVYNNVYRVTDPGHYQYSWGAGVESSIIARNNTFELAEGVPAAQIIRNFGGTGIDESGTWVNGRQVNVLDAYNAANPEAALAPEVSGAAGPHLRIEPAPAARERVSREAGSGQGS